MGTVLYGRPMHHCACRVCFRRHSCAWFPTQPTSIIMHAFQAVLHGCRHRPHSPMRSSNHPSITVICPITIYEPVTCMRNYFNNLQSHILLHQHTQSQSQSQSQSPPIGVTPSHHQPLWQHLYFTMQHHTTPHHTTPSLAKQHFLPSQGRVGWSVPSPRAAPTVTSSQATSQSPSHPWGAPRAPPSTGSSNSTVGTVLCE
jgi:hypothetical protein